MFSSGLWFVDGAAGHASDYSSTSGGSSGGGSAGGGGRRRRRRRLVEFGIIIRYGFLLELFSGRLFLAAIQSRDCDYV